MDSSGNIYGAAQGGGANGAGGIFELVPNGGSYIENVIYSFCPQSGCSDGQTPLDRLIMDTSGDLYGVTYQGGKYNGGSVFELIPNGKHTSWKLATLYSFCKKTNCADGYRPEWALSYEGAQSGQLYDGTSPLFGTTYQGGHGSGVAFELTYVSGRALRSERVIHKFCKSTCADGQYPQGVILNSRGVVFGITNGGGTHAGDGVVYKLTYDPLNDVWHEKVLYDFGSVSGDGCCQVGGLSMDSKGNLYGMSTNGGAHGVGTVWEVSPKGSETILYSLCSQQNCADGANADAGVTLDSGGNIFGETPNGGANNCGAIFEISGGAYSVLYNFGCNADNDFYEPSGGVILDLSGNLYGTAIGGGTHNSGGVYEYLSGAR